MAFLILLGFSIQRSADADSDAADANEQPILEPPPFILPPSSPTIVFDSMQVMVRTDPMHPEKERFLADWMVEIINIDDKSFPVGPSYYGHTSADGTLLMALPAYILSLPMTIKAYSTVLPAAVAAIDELAGNKSLEIFVPAHCHDKAVWMVGPFEDALWRYYKNASLHRAEAWNTSQVDCSKWLANMQMLILSDEINEELNKISPNKSFSEKALVEALQENQQFLTPTRPPICMAERRHHGSSMRAGKVIKPPTLLDESEFNQRDSTYFDNDPVKLDFDKGVVTDICTIKIAQDARFLINNTNFIPAAHYWQKVKDFVGAIHEQLNVAPDLDVSVYHTRLGNGREFDSVQYDDACAVTSIAEFTNKSDDEADLLTGSGVYFSNLFEGEINNTVVHLTSSGDQWVDADDEWVIFKRNGDDEANQKVIAVELLGHRQEDYRAPLQISYDPYTEDLSLILYRDYELNEADVDGEKGYLKYTIHVWDGSTPEGQTAIRNNLANCYEASDVWARHFLSRETFKQLLLKQLSLPCFLNVFLIAALINDG